MAPRAARVTAVLGSARGDGDAAGLLDATLAGRPARRFDIGSLRVRDYAYGGPDGDDDFVTVARALAESDAVVFVTPVYWYAMSAVLKRFFDRLTDLVTVRKSLGRQLAGRSVWLVACGSDAALPPGFEVPFRQTAAYFGMDYCGAHYALMSDGVSLSPEAASRAAAFGSRVYAAAAAG